MEQSLIVAADPRLFIRATALIVIALVVHALRMYGVKRGLRIILTILAITGFKELTQKDSPYVVSPSIAPGGLPLGIIFGWFIVTMLALEWSRLVSLLFRGGRGADLMFRVLWIVFFGAVAGNALEPIGQAVGWWRWVDQPFPCMADGIWAGMIPVFGLPALLAGAGVSARGIAKLVLRLAGAAGLACAVYFVFIDHRLPAIAVEGVASPAVAALTLVSVVLVLFAMYRSSGLPLDPQMLRPRAAGRMGAAHAIPSLCTWVILWVLVQYILPTPYASFWVYCLPLAAARLAMDIYWLHRWARASAPRRARANRVPLRPQTVPSMAAGA